MTNASLCSMLIILRFCVWAQTLPFAMIIMMGWSQCLKLGVWTFSFGFDGYTFAFDDEWFIILLLRSCLWQRFKFMFLVDVSLGSTMDFRLDSLLIGNIRCRLMVIDGFMFGFRSCFRTSCHHSMAGFRDSLWRHPVASLSWLDGSVGGICGFVDFVDVLGPSDGIGWFYCWRCGVWGMTREKPDELEMLICHYTI